MESRKNNSILYTKYNSYRRPEFRVRTSIIQEGDKKYAEKVAVCKEAIPHIQRIKDNYHKIKDLYNNITVLPYEDVYNEDGSLDESRVRLPFVEGTSLIDSVGFSNDIEELKPQLCDLIDTILNFKEEYITPFELSEGFLTVFPDYKPKIGEQSVKICDIDAIVQNIIVDSTGQMYLYDYEWVMDFTMPIEFLKYRILTYFLHYNSHYNNMYSPIDFLKEFRYTEENINNYMGVENMFQRMVHGFESSKLFIFNYLKPNDIVLKRLERQKIDIRNLNEHINYQSNQIQNQNEHIQNQNEHIQNQNEHIQNQNEHIQNLNKHIDNQGAVISNQKIQIHDRDEIIGDLNKVIDYQNLEINIENSKKKKLKRAVKNPIYGAYLAYNILINKYNEYKDMYSMDSKDELKRALIGEYDPWIRNYEKRYAKEELHISPKIQVISIKGDRESIESIEHSQYNNFELIVINDNEKLTDAFNEFDAEYVVIVDNSAQLDINAINEIAIAIEKNPNADIIYCDEDSIEKDGTRHTPIFKPDWSPDTLMSYDYIGSLCVIRKALLDKFYDKTCGGGLWKYDLLLKLTEKTDAVYHISKILCHTAKKSKTDLFEKKAIQEEALKRRGWNGIVEELSDINNTHIIYLPKDNPLVSIVIPSKDHPDVLRRCIESIDKITNYRNYEIIVVDNGSKAENKLKYQEIVDRVNGKYIYEPCDFNFSRMCNLGEHQASGEYILLLNDDTEVINGVWLERMLGHAQLPHVGVVGAKLYYTNSNLIQHMGVILQPTGPNHMALKHSDEDEIFDFRNRLEYNWSAATAACAMVSREKYNEVGGYSEELAVAYNDVDFSLKLLKKGYYNVVRQDAVLYHHESLSRGSDFLDEEKFIRLVKEEEKLRQYHPESVGDSYYSKFFSQDGPYEGFDLLGDVCCTISKKRYKKANRKYKYSIDTKGFAGGLSTIMGWVVKRRDPNKIESNVKLLYRGKEDYLCDTVKFFREDLRIMFPWENDVAFSGFYAAVPAGRIPVGKYIISIIYNDVEIETGREIEIML